MLHCPAAFVLRVNERGIACQLVWGLLAKNGRYTSVAEQCERAEMALGAAAAREVLDMEVCCLRAIAACIIPKGTGPVAVSNEGIDFKIIPNRCTKLSG
jgi:hypothetical protein